MWRLTWSRFRRSTLARLAVIYVLLLSVLAFLAPLIANRKPLLQRSGSGWSAPALADYWLDDPDLDRRAAPPSFSLGAPVPHSPNSIDLNVAYAPNWAEGLQFKVDVFNLFNSQKVTSVIETAEDPTTGVPVNTYLIPASFQAPRAVRFMVQYDF